MKNYKCSQCNTKCPTKTIFDHHTSVCKFIHTSCIENSIERYYREIDIPTHEAMVHYIFNLTRKYDELEEKVIKLQKSVISTRRKSIQEYLEELETPQQNFTIWANSIDITDEGLDILFKSDLKSAVKELLNILFEDSDTPIRAFTQKLNTFYLYDKSSEWRLMTSEEFIKFIEKIEHKFLKKFSIWMKEKENNENSITQEKIVFYMAKVNGIKQPNRLCEIKKWLYSKISMSLTKIII